MLKMKTRIQTVCISAVLLGFSCCPLLRGAQAFDPLRYQPPVKAIELDPDRAPIQLYVAPSGNDTLSGAIAGPFATLDRARDEVRKLKAAGKVGPGGVTINIAEGSYLLEHPLELTSADSGVENGRVVYRASKGQEVRILGGRRIDGRAFTAIKDPAKAARLSPSAVGKVLQLDLRALGVKHAGPFPDLFNDGGGIFELFFNGTRMPLSRWPATGYTTMQEVVTNGDKTTPGRFIYREDRPARWDASSGVWLKGQWRVGWEDPAIKVGSIDRETKQITFAVGLVNGIGSKSKRPKGSGQEPWCAINLLEEIAKPGQWCIDFTKGVMYFWPPGDLTKADILLSQVDRPLILARELSHTAFIGLTLENGLGDGMELMQARDVLVAGCTFRNLAGRGVVMDGEGCGIQSCDMYGLGKGCIVISGGDRGKLVESGNYVINNHLHHYGVLKAQYSAAIDLYSDSKNRPAVGMLIAHNLIHHAPRDAVLAAGNKVVFEYNEIHRCAYDTADTGAFYSWMNWTIRGLVIRYNYIHDTVGGVNPDDGASGSFVYGNIFAGDRTGVWIASGPGHVIDHNVFIKSAGPVFAIDDRGVGRGYASNKRLIDGVEKIHPADPPWSVEFPEMAALLQNHPELPHGTRFTRNMIWIKSGDPVKFLMHREHAKDPELLRDEGNFVTQQDPGFENAGSGLYRLKAGCPGLKAIPDFPSIRMERMGLQVDRYRKVLPTPAEAGRLPEQDPWKPGDTNKKFGT